MMRLAFGPKRVFLRVLSALLLSAVLLSAPAQASTERDAALYEAGMAAVSACVTEDMTDVEKLTALHDWLALHCDYGATRRCETAYGALVEHTANCVGYAEGYAYLARLAGLEGTVTYSEELDHAWILATLDGVRYFSDCTWDDGKYEKLGLIRHRYWLFDGENAAAIGHYGWDSGEPVPGGALEYAPWGSAVTRVIFEGDYAYYIDDSFRLWRCDRGTWETEILWRTEDRWPDTDPEDGKDPELYTSLIYFGGRLFFNTARGVYSVDTEGREVRTVTEPEPDGDRCLYGIAVRDGLFCCSLADAPGALLYDIVNIAPVRNVWGESLWLFS